MRKLDSVASLILAIVMLPIMVWGVKQAVNYLSRAADQTLPEKTETVSGDLMGFFKSNLDKNQTEIFYFIKTDTETLELSSPLPSLDLDKVRPGMKVQATGKRTGPKFTVSDIVASEPTETAADPAPQSYNGIFRLAVVPINFSNLSGNFPGESYIQTVVNGTVANFFTENSYGKLSFNTASSDIYPPVTISAEADCGILDLAFLPILVDPDVDFSKYNFIAFLMPDQKNRCGTVVEGTVGTNPYWVDGGYHLLGMTLISDDSFTLPVISSGLGFNLGAHLANAKNCGREAIGENCTYVNGGDPWEPLGAFAPHHFNAWHKYKFGWIDDLNWTSAQRGNTYLVKSLEKPASAPFLQFLEVKNAFPKWSYYVEYRTSFGYDSSLPVGSSGGIVIHQVSWPVTVADGDTHLIDVRPQDGQANFNDAFLRPGEAFYDQENDLVIAFVKPINDTLGEFAEVKVDRYFSPCIIVPRVLPGATQGDTTFIPSSGTTLFGNVRIGRRETQCQGRPKTGTIRISGGDSPDLADFSELCLRNLKPPQPSTTAFIGCPTTGLVVGQTYTWYATYQNGINPINESKWANFTVARAGVPEITQVAPANGSTFRGTTATLTAKVNFHTDIGVRFIDFYVAKDEIFGFVRQDQCSKTSGLNDNVNIDCQITVEPNHRYFWYVVAANELFSKQTFDYLDGTTAETAAEKGGGEDVGEPWSFKVGAGGTGCKQPGAPEITDTAPLDGEVLPVNSLAVPLRGNVTYHTCAGVRSRQVFVKDITSGTPPAVLCSFNDTKDGPFSCTFNVARGHVYEWYVEATNERHTGKTPKMFIRVPPVSNLRPVIGTETLPQGKRGVSYTGEIIGYDYDVNDTLTLTATSEFPAPAWLSIGMCTQKSSTNYKVEYSCPVSGTPAKSGSATIDFKLTDNQGSEFTKKLILKVR